jgi:hypothetical protein
MKKLIDLATLDRLDSLIRRKATGTPIELAQRLRMSRSTLFELIAFLRDEMRAPIRYSKYKMSYIYDYQPKFYLGFEKERLKSLESGDVSGGSESDSQDSNSDDNPEDAI